MNKPKKLQIFRVVIQIVMLFLLPGLFIMAFNELKEVVKMIASFNFNFIQVIPSLVELIALTVLTMIMGRVFCGWFCAFGAYNDLIYLASKKIFKTRFKINENIDSYLKYLKYVVLFTILLVSSILGSKIFSSASPWDVFAQISDFPNVLISLPIGFSLLLLITIGAFFIERFFCRYLCPLGAFFSLISRMSILKIRKPSSKCGPCRVCTNNCSMGLKLYKKETVHGGDCINCLKCIEVCPRRNACVNILGQDVNPAFASSAAMAAFIGIYGASNLGGYIINQRIPESTRIAALGTTNTSSQKYKDGTYQGSGTGFRGGTTIVELTISNGKITDITTISSEDTPDFYERAFSDEADKIISSQSTDIDTVSGATYSSEGIISAVKDALSKAEASAVQDTISSNTTSSTENTDTSDTANLNDNANESVQSESTDNNDNAQINNNTADNNSTTEQGSSESYTSNTKQEKYKDGTYTGEGTGFRGGTTEISVTISGGKITTIETLSTDDTPRFYDRCEETITSEMISLQTTSIDTVSGATYSSNGIISAVKDALSKAIY